MKAPLVLLLLCQAALAQNGGGENAAGQQNGLGGPGSVAPGSVAPGSVAPGSVAPVAPVAPPGQPAIETAAQCKAAGGRWEGKGVAGELLVPTAATHQFTFDLPPGQYSAMVIHDENDNGKLDSNIIGIPTEAYGFSNNPRVMRKPSFDETRFELPAAGTLIKIDLN